MLRLNKFGLNVDNNLCGNSGISQLSHPNLIVRIISADRSEVSVAPGEHLTQKHSK